MGFPAVYYCVILPPPLHSFLYLLECISRGCALPAALLFSGDGDEGGTASADVGIKSRLPVVRFSGSAAAGASPRCAVCLAAVEEGTEVRQLGNCSHAFHLPCIDRWVDMGHFTCPLCRSLL
ncbi:hypothetical protein E2562_025460 [Oryza meyeriana var. granulata]|uniref:RING-type domain-containing protein n=1 Tax=Oryza meyeriana var. granulata TaxID=110450 RepID=A0A6G1D702_9ORYZ|nr:hypothetical protein E2562_025460 [Oryza meyeriana var. granulata]